MPDCMVCHEVITQPLCAACHEQQVAAWLMERIPERPGLLLELSDRREELEGIHGTTPCIKCKHLMDLCSYCYTMHVFTWIKRVYPEGAGEFMHLFFQGRDRVHVEEVLPSPTLKPVIA